MKSRSFYTATACFLLFLTVSTAQAQDFYSVNGITFAGEWKRPQITINMDRAPTQFRHPVPFSINTPIEIVFTSSTAEAASAWIYLKHEDEEYMSKRVLLTGDSSSITFWFYPMPGSWEAGIVLGAHGGGCSILFDIEGE